MEGTHTYNPLTGNVARASAIRERSLVLPQSRKKDAPRSALPGKLSLNLGRNSLSEIRILNSISQTLKEPFE
jgi:hypothetical protein